MKKLICDVRQIFEGRENCLSQTETEYVQNIFKNYKSNSLDWQKYAQFHPLKYTRNLIDMIDNKFNLLVLCWGPRQFSGIHDHTNSHCFVKVLQGQLLETRYAWPNSDDTPLNKIGSDLYETNDVTYISDQIGLHRMENQSHTDETVTLHLYTPPLNHCQIFDLRTGKKANKNSSYHTKFGVKVKPPTIGQTSTSLFTLSTSNIPTVLTDATTQVPFLNTFRKPSIVRNYQSG